MDSETIEPKSDVYLAATVNQAQYQERPLRPPNDLYPDMHRSPAQHVDTVGHGHQGVVEGRRHRNVQESGHAQNRRPGGGGHGIACSATRHWNNDELKGIQEKQEEIDDVREWLDATIRCACCHCLNC